MAICDTHLSFMSDKKPSKKFHEPVRDERMPESKVVKKKSPSSSRFGSFKKNDDWRSDKGDKPFKDKPGKKTGFSGKDRKGNFKGNSAGGEESRSERDTGSRAFFKEALMRDQRIKPELESDVDRPEKSFSERKRDFKDKKPGGFKKGPFKAREEKEFKNKKPSGFKKGPFKPGEEKDFKEKKQEGFKKSSFKGRDDRDFKDKKPGEFKKGPFKDRDEKEAKRKSFLKRENRPDKFNSIGKTDRKGGSKKTFSKKSKAEITDGTVRLNRFIANSGVCSRRDADELIRSGRIEVNGAVVTEMGYKVGEKDVVKFAGKRLINIKPVYIIMNKPKDCICTAEDPEGRRTVLDILEDDVEERVFPVGRLDRNTTGVLLITNDGELTQKLTHPSSNLSKVYAAVLEKPLENEHFEQLLAGIELEDGPMKADDLAFSDPGDRRKIGIEIHSGRNRIIHRMFEHLGYKLERLDRVLFAGMDKRGLKRGEWRYLNEKEITSLKRLK